MQAKKKIRVALSGNPNSGKSTLFNALTGSRQHIANYPGVTVEKKSGTVIHKGIEIEVVDLPGIYSLSAFSIEEQVARNFVLEESPDMVVDVVDASNLERNLYLFVQLMELGCPLILALNMMDMAKARGIHIDVEKLSKHLGVRVIPMTARSGEGILELLDAILEEVEKPRHLPQGQISYGRDVDEALGQLERLLQGANNIPKRYPPKWLALKFLEGDQIVTQLLEAQPDLISRARPILADLALHTMDTIGEDLEAVIADQRYGFITSVVKHCLRREIENRLNLSDRIDKVLTNRLFGPIFMLLVLYAVYLLIFWISERPVSWIETGFSFLREKADSYIRYEILRSLVTSGVIDGVGGIMGYIPLIFFMFGAIAVLEDSGYMARIAYMMDRFMRFFGLHGSSVIALIVSGGISGGCAVPGILATRTLKDNRERLATALVTPFMNCGGKLPVYAIIISAFFPEGRARMLFFLTIFSWLVALVSARLLRGIILRGPKSPFIMELPPYRLPTLRGLLIHSWERTWLYIKRAGTLILAFSILFWAGLTFPGPDRKERERLEHLKEEHKTRLQEETKRGLYGPEEIEKKEKEIMALLEAEERASALKASILGRAGVWLEKLTGYLGFDYKLNLALLSGVFAKEMIVATLGTVYSMEGVYENGSVEDRLKKDPRWTPSLAFLVLIFVTLYIPCLPTLLTIASELSYKWALVSACFNLGFTIMLCSLLRAGMLLFGL